MEVQQQLSMNPYLLTFSNIEFERRYEKRQNQNFCITDRWFCFFSLVTLTAFIVVEWILQCEPVGILIPVCALTSIVLQLMLMEFCSRHWVEYRFYYICILRSMRVTMSMFGIQYWMYAPGYQPSPFKSLVIGSGSIVNFWDAFGQPVLFRYHLLLQIPLSMMMLYFTGWPQCKDFANFPQILEAIQQFKKTVTSLKRFLYESWRLDGSHACLDVSAIVFVGIDRDFKAFE